MVVSDFKDNAVLISSLEYVLELIVTVELFDVKDNGAFTATPFNILPFNNASPFKGRPAVNITCLVAIPACN